MGEKLTLTRINRGFDRMASGVSMRDVIVT